MPFRRLLVRTCGAEHRLLVKGLAEYLQSYRKAALREPAGDRYAGHPGEVAGYGEYVREVHCKRVFDLLAYPECRSRGRRRGDDVAPREGRVEVVLHERPHLRGLLVVGVVVAGGEGVCAEHYPAFHLGPEALVPGLLVHVHEPARPVDAKAEPHAVVPGEVARRLCRGYEVIDSDSVLRVRKGYLDKLGSERLQRIERLFHGGVDFRVHAFDEVFLRYADLEALYACLELRRIIRHRRVYRRGVEMVSSRDRIEQDGRGLDILCERACLVKGRREGYHAEPRYPAVCGLEADDAAARGRVPYRAANIGSERG